MSKRGASQHRRCELFIIQHEDDYIFILEGSEAGASYLKDEIRVPENIRRGILDRLHNILPEFGRHRGTGMATCEGSVDLKATVREIGQHISRLMVPADVRERIRALKPSSLIISTDDPEIPWELLHDGDDFYCLKYSVGRKQLAEEQTTQKDRAMGVKPKALFISNPTMDLPDAEEEVGLIIDAVKAAEIIEIHHLKGKEASVTNLIDILTSCEFDILHFAGHTSYDDRNPRNSELVLSDGEVATSYLCDIMSDPDNPVAPPRLAFFNSCSSAGAGMPDYRGCQHRLTGMAQEFLQIGVNAYIGTLWPVHDEVASQLSIAFYRNIISADTIGSALRKAKAKIQEEYGEKAISWASFLLYGEPDTRIVGSLTADELRLLVMGAGIDGSINPTEFRNLVDTVRRQGFSDPEGFVSQVMEENNIVLEGGFQPQ